MTILYSAVFKGSVTAAQFASIDGNFNAVAKEFLAKGQIGRNDGKFTYNVEGTTFNFLTKEGISFLCVAAENYGRIMPAAFLDKLAEAWAAEVGAKAQQALQEGQLTSSFGKRIKALMEQIAAHPEQFSKLQAVQKKVDVAKGVMLDNMQQMMVRQDQLDTMVEKSTNLLEASSQFQTQGKKLRTHMWWQNFKMQIIVAAALVLLVLVIFLVVCFGVAHCFHHSSSASPSPSPIPSPSLVLSPSPISSSVPIPLTIIPTSG